MTTAPNGRKTLYILLVCDHDWGTGEQRTRDKNYITAMQCNTNIQKQECQYDFLAQMEGLFYINALVLFYCILFVIVIMCESHII